MNNIFSVRNMIGTKKEGDLPMRADIYIDIAPYSTPSLVHDTEIDYEIDCLIKELEKVRKAAKTEIKQHNQKMRNVLNNISP